MTNPTTIVPTPYGNNLPYNAIFSGVNHLILTVNEKPRYLINIKKDREKKKIPNIKHIIIEELRKGLLIGNQDS